MIFDKDYDRTLWLMLSLDKDNRERILEFMENIPDELVLKIKEGLNKYLQFKNGELSEYSVEYLYGDVSNDDKEFAFNICDDCLEICQAKVLGEGSYRNMYEISILPVGATKTFGKMGIGNFSYNYRPVTRIITSCDKVDYNLIKIPFVTLLTFEKNEELSFVKQLVDVSLREFPEDIKLDDFRDKSKLKKGLRRVLDIKYSVKR